jgi:orotate phosphoribosyltransferase
VHGRRVAIVNDVISAGSAVRGTLKDLRALGANVVAVGALLALGSEFRSFANDNGLTLETLVDKTFNLWTPAECPLCGEGKRIEEVG